MAYDIRLVKLVNGDLVIGKFEANAEHITECAALQTVPTQQGMQMMLLPFGYPFEQDFHAQIEMRHVMYEYKTFPDDLKTKYLEACSNLTLSSGGLGGLNLSRTGAGSSKVSDISSLLKK
ncbi:MAG: hypothetical protein R3Y11_06135 [Pseudomonadota bacterium]